MSKLTVVDVADILLDYLDYTKTDGRWCTIADIDAHRPLTHEDKMKMTHTMRRKVMSYQGINRRVYVLSKVKVDSRSPVTYYIARYKDMRVMANAR